MGKVLDFPALAQLVGVMMTNRRSLLLMAAAAFVSGPVAAEEAGFVPLFDGKTLDGWTNPYGWGVAEVKDGEIHLTADRKFFLVTKETYGDFVFEGEVHLPEGKANSGFMFRAHVEKNKVFGYQAEVDGDENRKWSGGLYDEGRRAWFISPVKEDPKKAKDGVKAVGQVTPEEFRARAGDAFRRNDWNRYRITCRGKRLTIEVNGVVTTDCEDGVDASGVIAIQHHGEKGATYRFRNLRVRKL